MSISEEEIRSIVADVISRLGTREKGKKCSVAIGADHGGFALKEYLREYLRNIGYSVEDCGAYSKEAVDYPDVAVKVAERVAAGAVDRGIMLDGAGIGSSMAANKIKGVRAALCYNEKTILNSMQHNCANMLTMGAPYHSEEEAAHLVKLWLATEFEGGRHQRRVDKINLLDACNCQKSACSGAK